MLDDQFTSEMMFWEVMIHQYPDIMIWEKTLGEML